MDEYVDDIELLDPTMYSNPVISQDWPDPTIWKGDDGYFYSVCTGLKEIKRSQDLVKWEHYSEPLSKKQVEILKKYGNYFWAPHVVEIHGERLMYISLYNNAEDSKIAVLRDDFKTGEFKFVSVITDSNITGIKDTIDPFVLYEDSSERVILFFGSIAGVYRVDLSYDGLSLGADPKYTHIAGQPSWVDQTRQKVFEGSYLYYHDGYWYLFVSAGYYNTYNYHLLVGRSESFDGPFYDHNGLPMMEGNAKWLMSTLESDFFYGPGHNGEILEDNNGHTYIFYHCHKQDLKGSGSYIPRPMMLQELLWDDAGWPYFENDSPHRICKRPVFN